jgi:pentatricopeptide repeat protein
VLVDSSSSAITVCRLCRRLLLLRALTESSWIACLHATLLLVQGGLWQEALALMNEAVNDGIPLDSRSYYAAIRACRHSGNWRRAVSLLTEAQQYSHVTADVGMYTEAIAACCAADCWEQGLALLQQMKGSSVQPGIAAYSPLIEALLRAGLQQLAVKLYREACSSTSNSSSSSSSSSSSERGAGAAAKAPSWRPMINNSLLDLRHHSPALAALAMRCCLEQWVAQSTVLREELVIIVGINSDSTGIPRATLSATQAAVQAAVKEVFAALRIRCTVPATNLGRLVVPHTSIMQYLDVAKRKQLQEQQRLARIKSTKRL